jgi:hypothetical protein
MVACADANVVDDDDDAGALGVALKPLRSANEAAANVRAVCWRLQNALL